MSTVTLTPPNAILFVFDPSNQNVTVPDYVNAQLIAANATCISVGTQAPVDGDTVVSLCEPETYRKGLEKVFDGRIETPSRRVAVVTSEFQQVLEMSVSSTITDVAVWADDLRSPGRLVVEVS